MRVLIVSDYGTLSGGVERTLFTLRDGLRKEGHDVRFFASSTSGGDSEFVADYRCFGTSSAFRTLLQTANPDAYFRLRRVLREFRPQVVHVGMFLTQLSPLILPLLREFPSLYDIHWLRPVCPIGTKLLPDGTECHHTAGKICYLSRCLPVRDALPLAWQMQFWRSHANNFSAFMTNSDFMRQRLAAEGIEIDRVIHPGLPISPQRPRLGNPPTVAYAGRLSPEKGLAVLLRSLQQVAEQIPNVRLLIAGAGPERDALELQSRSLGVSDRVTWLGHLNPDEMEHQLAGAWVQVVPSLWPEPFGRTAAEAHMRGTAVVASDCGGLPEIVINDENGFLVTPNNVGALAQALLRLFRNPTVAEEFGERGRIRALANFDEATYVRRIVEVHSNLLNHPQP